MPFTSDTVLLVGHAVSIRPEHGFGWAVVDNGAILQELAAPNAFEAEIADILLDSTEVRAIACKLKVVLSERSFVWGALVPRTTLMIDLRVRSVGCNILLSDQKPYVDEGTKFPDPNHVWTSSTVHVRGFGRVSLVGS